MNEEIFIEKMIDLMDTDEVINMDSLLVNIEEWDSLSYVAFLAMSSMFSDKEIAPIDVKNAKTIGDLYKLLKNEE